MTRRTIYGCIAPVLALGACSDDGTGAPNNAPSFTVESINLEAPENSGATLAVVTVSDPDGDAVTLALEGDDASQFEINVATGALSFASAPDFEAPADADGDNVYRAFVRGTDTGGLSATLPVTVTVSNLDEPNDPVRNRDLVFANVDVQRDIEFATVNGVPLLMDIFTPVGDTATDRPVMIVASGGGFLVQDREGVEPIAQDFARRGYVAATMDYRVLSGNPLTSDELAIGGLEATHDMFAAVRFFRADALGANTRGIRSDAIFVAGESAGAVMAFVAATFDDGDTAPSAGTQSFLDANGGAFGNVGGNTDVASNVQGALGLSGGILDLSWIGADSAILYAAHDEFDGVVPCETAPEGSSFTGLVISGGCDIVPAYEIEGVGARLFLVAGSTGHVSFDDAQRTTIFQDAATLFFDEVINAGP